MEIRPFAVSDTNYQSDWNKAYSAWHSGDYATAVSLWEHLAEREIDDGLRPGQVLREFNG
jgi:hypothetical protein